MIVQSIDEQGGGLGVAPLCDALDVPRSAVYRQRSRRDRQRASGRPNSRPKPPNALSEKERAAVLEILDSPRFCDMPPDAIYAHLLDQGAYYCSPRTMYRILDSHKQVKERRDQLRHPQRSAPQLKAAAANQVWTWDITKLKGPRKGQCYFLYVIIDLYSRFVTGWMAAEKENAELARMFIGETIEKHKIKPDSLVLHSDRGSPMISKSVAQLLSDLGVEKSHSRPRVSNDNAFSESQFKTLKYSPQFPGRFGSIEDARGFCRRFFQWYNHEHHHSGIALLTPAQAHNGRAEHTLKKRHQTLMEAYRNNPMRFRNIAPKKQTLPGEVWINQPKDEECKDEEPLISSA